MNDDSSICAVLSGSIAGAAAAVLTYAVTPGWSRRGIRQQNTAAERGGKDRGARRRRGGLSGRIAALEQKGSGFVTVKPLKGSNLPLSRPSPIHPTLFNLFPKAGRGRCSTASRSDTVPLSGGAQQNHKSGNSSGAIIWEPSSPGVAPVKGTEGPQTIADFSPAEPTQPATREPRSRHRSPRVIRQSSRETLIASDASSGAAACRRAPIISSEIAVSFTPSPASASSAPLCENPSSAAN